MGLLIIHGVVGRVWKQHMYEGKRNKYYIYSPSYRKKYREDAAKVRKKAQESAKNVDKAIEKLLYGSINYDMAKVRKYASSSFLEKLINKANDKSQEEQELLIENAQDFLIGPYKLTYVGKKYKRFKPKK